MREGRTMEDLLMHFRSWMSHDLVGISGWRHLCERARRLPITMGSHPFGFEVPLHAREPCANLSVVLASGTRSAIDFVERAQTDGNEKSACALLQLFERIESDDSNLRAIIGRKLMLEYITGPDGHGECSQPRKFLRADQRPIIGVRNQLNDVDTVANALASLVDWQMNDICAQHLRRVYLALPDGVRMDSFGIVPQPATRSCVIRVAITGFRLRAEIRGFLDRLDWSGSLSAVNSVFDRFEQRMHIVRVGLNVEVEQSGIGPTLGLMFIGRQKHIRDSHSWLDGLTDWDPLVDALCAEEIIQQKKLAALTHWTSKPTRLYAKSGSLIALRGIHHVKLVICAGELKQINAYLYLALSALSGG